MPADVTSCGPCTGKTFDPNLLTSVCQASSDLLYILSGSRWPGVCSAIVRPTAQWHTRDIQAEMIGRSTPWGFSFPYGTLWPWFNYYGNASDRFGSQILPEITLGGYPVVSINYVMVDGAVVPSSQYRIDDYRYLLRLPDPADPTNFNPGWPTSNRADLPNTAKGTFEVSFAYGKTPPEMGKRAAIALACEMAIGCSPGTGNCRLPERVTSIVRDGMSAVMLDPESFFKEGKLGLWQTDVFLMTYNPSHIKRRASVINPDAPRRVRRAGT